MNRSLSLALYFFFCFLAPVSGRWGTLGQEHVCVSEYRWRTRAGRLEEESQATEPSGRAKLYDFGVLFFPSLLLRPQQINRTLIQLGSSYRGWLPHGRND